MKNRSSRSRASRRALLCLSTVLVSGLAIPATAQAATEPEPYHSVDEFGVDLSTGTFNFSIAEVTGGSASTGVDVQRTWGNAGWVDGYAGHLKQTNSTTVVVTRGAESETFTLTSGVWVAAKANGAKLTKGTRSQFPIFTYTAPDGTTIGYRSVGSMVFAPNDAWPRWFTITGEGGPCQITTAQLTASSPELCAVPVLITAPNGKQIGLSWDEEGSCAYHDGQSSQGYQCDERYRLTEIHDYNGYRAEFTYDSTNWGRRTGSTFTDLSTGNATTATYSVPSSGTQQVVDQNGLTWTFVFDTAGRLTSITRPGASSATTTIAYDTNGKVSSVTKDGVTKTYTWTTSGGNTVVAISGGAGGSGSVTSDTATGEPGTVTDANSNSVVNTYDSNKRLKRTTSPEGNYVEYTYDTRGNVTQTQFVPKSGSGLSTLTTSAGFDLTCSNTLTCNQPNYTIDARGNQTDYTYSSLHGQLTRVQFPAPASGQARPEINYGYTALYAQEKDLSGNLVNVDAEQYKLTQITSCATAATCAGTANETKVTITYATPNLQPSSVTVAAGDGSISSTTTYAYDAKDNLASVDGPLSGTDDTEYYFYDTSNRLVGSITPDPDGSGSNPRLASRLTYDTAGRVWKTESGTATGTAKTDLDAMTVYRTVEITFDANNNKTVEKLKDSNGTVVSLVQYSYDSAGRLQCTAVRMNSAIYGSLPSDACALGTEGSYGPDRITKLTYDSAGRVTRQESGYGTAAVGDDGVLTYTANGQVATAKDGEANLTTYEYDGFDRLAKTRLPVSTKGAASSSTTDYEQYGYDANGNVTSRRTRAGETIAFAYDALNRLTTKTVPERSGLSSTHTRDVYYGYDVMSRPSYARFDSASGEGISFVFDALGRMTSTIQAMDGASRTLSYLHDAAGRRTRVTWPDSGFVAYSYDTLNRPTTITDSDSATLRSYTYGSAGNLSAESAGGAVSTSYGIDPAGRLSSLTNDLSGTSADLTTTFGYNPANQLVSENRNNDSYAWGGHANANQGYALNGLNQYTSSGAGSAPYGTAYTYDANGNLTSDGSNTFSYDVENRLISASGSTSNGSLRYDPLGRLYELTEGGATTRMLYDADALTGEYSASGTLLRRFVHGSAAGVDDPVAWFEGTAIAANTRRLLQVDRLGSVISVVDNSGTNLSINTYDEYGSPGTSNLGRFQYTGQAWLASLNLYYYKTRMYSPALGRFLQVDPVGYADGLNSLIYVHNNPINFVDTLGLAGEKPGADGKCAAGKTKESDGLCYPTTADITVTGQIGGQIGFGSGGGSGGGGGAAGSWSAPDVVDPPLVVTAPRPVDPRWSAIVDYGLAGGDMRQFEGIDTNPQIVVTALVNAVPVGSANKTDANHNIPFYIQVLTAYYGTRTDLKGGDGKVRALYQIKGSMGNVDGRFEFIVDGGLLTHRMFVPGGAINGRPIVK